MLPGMTYTWRVRMTYANTALSESSLLWGPWSQPFTFKTPPPSISTIALASPANGSVVSNSTPTLQWSNSDSSIFYYEVQVSKDPKFGSNSPLYWELRHGGVTTPQNSYTVPNGYPLEPATTYYWRVRPRVQGDGSPVDWSPNWTFRAP